MAYGDIHISNGGQFPIDKNPMSTVTHAVQIRNSGSSVDYRSDSLDLDKLVGTRAYKGAGVYVGVQGNILVDLSNSPAVMTGTTVTDTSNKLVDAGFSGGDHDVLVGDRVENLTDGSFAFVSAIDSDTTLSLVTVPGGSSAKDIFSGTSGAPLKYAILRPVLFEQVAAGSFLPIKVNRIYSTLTTADDIMAIY